MASSSSSTGNSATASHTSSSTSSAPSTTTTHTIGSNANWLGRAGLPISGILRAVDMGLISKTQLQEEADEIRKNADNIVNQKGKLVALSAPLGPPVPILNNAPQPKMPTPLQINQIMTTRVSQNPGIFTKPILPVISSLTKQPMKNNLVFGQAQTYWPGVSILQDLRYLPEYRSALEVAGKTVYGGGTCVGMMNRLITASTSVNRMVLNKRWERDFIVDQSVMKMLMPLKPTFEKFTRLDQVKYDVHGEADYGSPRPGEKKKDHLEELVIGMVNLLNIFKKNEQKEYFQKHLEEYLVFIKNKSAPYLLENWEKKIRPYYVYPGKLALLYSHVMAYMTDQVVCAVDSESSCYLPGFSWAHGGTFKLAQIIYHCNEHGGDRIFIYADDVTIVYWDKTYKEVRVVMIDVTGLDMSFLSVDAPGLTKQILPPYEERMADYFQEVFKFLVIHGLSKPVLFPHGLFFQLKFSLGSGISGTTFLGTHAMLAPTYEYYSKLKETGWRSNDAPKAADIYQKYGMALKLIENTKGLKGFDLRPDGNFREPGEEFESDFSILGQKLAFMPLDGEGHGVWYPKPSLEKLVVSYVRCPASALKPIELNILARIVGLLVSGGWCYEEFYNALKRDYERCAGIVSGLTPNLFRDYIEQLGQGFDESVALIVPYLSKTLPDRLVFRSIYTDEVPLHTNQPNAGAYDFSDMDTILTGELRKQELLPSIPEESKDGETSKRKGDIGDIRTVPISRHTQLGPTPPQAGRRQREIDRKRARSAAEQEKRQLQKDLTRDDPRNTKSRRRDGKRNDTTDDPDGEFDGTDINEEVVEALEEEERYKAIIDEEEKKKEKRAEEVKNEEYERRLRDFDVDTNEDEDTFTDHLVDDQEGFPGLRSGLDTRARVFLRSVPKHQKPP